MITPRFRAEQSETEVMLFIHAPYTDINSTEIHVDQEQVCFHSSPYYLRLHLPGQVVEDDRSKGTYDADRGEFIILLPKVNPGEHFKDLNLVNALLNPLNKGPANATPNIEVIGGDPAVPPSEKLQDFDWFIDQQMEEVPETAPGAPTYGFGNLSSSVFRNLESELPELLDLPNPDTTLNSERATLQEAAENKAFSPEHYLADWAEESQAITTLLFLKMPWEAEENENLSEKEQEQLLRIHCRELLPLNESEQRSTLLSIAELIFCWAHEQRCAEGDPGPESARSVRRLSATFSWLRQFQSVKELVLNCVRRALCVPLYRNWKLALRALQDTQQILNKGRVRVLRVLVDLLGMFKQCESHHVLSQLYLEPFCVWLQTSVTDQALSSLATAIEKAIPSKNELGWELEQLESAGKMVMEEETALQLAAQVRTRLTVSQPKRDSDDESSDEDSESSSGDYSCCSTDDSSDCEECAAAGRLEKKN